MKFNGDVTLNSGFCVGYLLGVTIFIMYNSDKVFVFDLLINLKFKVKPSLFISLISQQTSTELQHNNR